MVFLHSSSNSNRDLCAIRPRASVRFEVVGNMSWDVLTVSISCCVFFVSMYSPACDVEEAEGIAIESEIPW